MVDSRPLQDAAERSRAERARVSRLRGYDIVGTPAERDFDDIAVLAAQLCSMPMALVTLVETDRQWFKARVGLEVCETPREVSFCAHAMYGDAVLQVPDAQADPRFATNQLVIGEPYVRFYAGAPLIAPGGGERLGSLCVMGSEPGLLTPAQCQGLLTLARHVVVALEMRQYLRGAEQVNQRLQDAERLKDEFLARISHELRTPLTSIQGYLEVLDDADVSRETAAAFLARIRRNSDRLLGLVDDMLLAAQLSAAGVTLYPQPTDLTELARAAVVNNQPLAEAKGLRLTTDGAGPVFADVDARRLDQALDRLVLNAIKFTTEGVIVVRAGIRDDAAVLEVTDTGVGFPAEERDRLFAAFRRTRSAERDEMQGVGLGLSIVKAIIDGHGGTVGIDSTPGQGTTVTIRLPAGVASS